MALRSISFRRIGNRDIPFMGGDREMVLFSGLIAGTMIFIGMSWSAALYGVMLWVVALALFRKMWKVDPKMRFVYFRSLKYRSYYPARSTPFHNNRRKYSATKKI